MFVPDGERPKEIDGEKLNLKQFHAKYQVTGSNDLVSTLFPCVLVLFLSANHQVAKNLLTEIYKNLILKSLSSENNSRISEFSALTEIYAEINARIADLFFENQEKSKSEKLAQEMQISEQDDFFNNETSIERDEDLRSEGETENKLEDIKKDYEEPAVETAIENEEKTEKDDQEVFETEQKINKVDFEATKDKEIKDIVEKIDVVKRAFEISH